MDKKFPLEDRATIALKLPTKTWPSPLIWSIVITGYSEDKIDDEEIDYNYLVLLGQVNLSM